MVQLFEVLAASLLLAPESLPGAVPSSLGWREDGEGERRRKREREKGQRRQWRRDLRESLGHTLQWISGREGDCKAS